jgi:hypothetical protein
MRRLLTSLSLAVLSLALLAAPAAACINDSETPSAEREFKSHYQEGSPPSESQPSSQLITLATGTGGALLLGALGLVLFRLREPR